ncbi:hypothetical protein TNCV_3149531 [Trichonephila clavipes]|nr:hypothetical protein TNCV_3149531 [Trichonephila clavipes]
MKCSEIGRNNWFFCNGLDSMDDGARIIDTAVAAPLEEILSLEGRIAIITWKMDGETYEVSCQLATREQSQTNRYRGG